MPTAGVRRKLFNLAAAVSLVLCIAIAALWAFDYNADLSPNFPQRPITRTRYAVAVQHRRLEIRRYCPPGALRWPDDYREAPGTAVFGYSRSALGGWATLTGPRDQFADVLTVYAPLWSVLLLTAVLPLCRAGGQYVVRRRRLRGCCPTCGYDCRGPAAGTLLARCPECGNPTGTVTFSAPSDASPDENAPGGKGGCPPRPGIGGGR